VPFNIQYSKNDSFSSQANHHNTKHQLFLKYLKINQIILIELIIFSRLKDLCIISSIKKSVDQLEVALVQRIRFWKFVVKRCKK